MQQPKGGGGGERPERSDERRRPTKPVDEAEDEGGLLPPAAPDGSRLLRLSQDSADWRAGEEIYGDYHVFYSQVQYQLLSPKCPSCGVTLSNVRPHPVHTVLA